MKIQTNKVTPRRQVRLLDNVALPATQRGAALAISLVFLLLLTIIGITATTSSRLEEKMSGNLRDLSASEQMSESGLRAAGDWVRQQAVGGTPLPENNPPGAGEVWILGSAGSGNLATATSSWWMTDGLEYGVTGTDEFVSTDPLVYFQAYEDPRYVVEGYGSVVGDASFGSQNSQAYYRTTAFGTGLTGNAQTVTQGSVFTRFN
jgi:type IV pilus assembly protein PilX